MFNLASLDSLLPLQHFAQFEGLLSGFGITNTALSLLVFGSGQLGPTISLHGLMWLDSAASHFESGTAGPLMSLHSFSCCGSTFFASDMSTYGSAISLRSFMHLDALLFPPDSATAGLLLLLKPFAQLNSVIPSTSISCTGTSAFAFDTSTVELAPSLHSFARLGFAPLALDLASSGFLLSLQGYAHLESLSFFAGIQCVGSVFSSSVLHTTTLDLPLPLHSFSQISFASPPVEFSNTDLTLPLLG